MIFLRSGVLFFASLVASVASAGNPPSKKCPSVLHEQHPILCHMLDRLEDDHSTLAAEMTAWADEHGLLVGDDWDWENLPLEQASISSQEDQLPVVFAHGMGDSCFNNGMKGITDATSQMLGGVYTTCIPTGKTQQEDTSNGYFLNMDASVDVFAEAIQQDPKLRKGFHAIGFSQGNNVIRGYIARFNDPPVNTFISVNGVNAGVGAVPYCQPKGNLEEESEDSLQFSMCDLLMEQASKRAYTEWTQQHSFQANYWRDPRPVEREAYESFGQLARWNNEGEPFNKTIHDNFALTQHYVWILATEDQMVWPKEGEHWGAPDPNDPFHSILPMNETEWYQKDLFGLKTAQEAGKNHFESFEGDHLQFSMDQFTYWVHTYLAAKGEQASVAVE